MSFDPQATSVFLVEAEMMETVVEDSAIRSIEDTEHVLELVQASPEVIKDFPGGKLPKVSINAMQQRDTSKGGTEIILGREASHWSLVHELAHTMTNPFAEQHGKAFCGNLIKVVRAVWGELAAEMLVMHFDQRGVSYPQAAERLFAKAA